LTRIGIIGAGFSGLSSACCLAQAGFDVTIFEKNSTTGGRARSFEKDGFVFDMGPSWYWMPEVFEQFFDRFGKKVSDYYQLQRLDPSYRVFFPENEQLDMPADMEMIRTTFESLEKGSAQRLDRFLHEAMQKYKISMRTFVWKPSHSITEYMDFRLLRETFRLALFRSFSRHASQYFSNSKILRILEFPVLFLGAKPERTPALYSMMNYADLSLGTWYPQGGMGKIAEAMTNLAAQLGVKLITDAEVQKISIAGNKAVSVIAGNVDHEVDALVASADYEHVEQQLLSREHRVYDDDYWKSRVMSPSSLIFYLGIDKKIDGLLHHNLFFDEDFTQHASTIYDSKTWPQRPLFYVCCPSKSDSTVSPAGKENLFILIPVATNISSDERLRDQYLQMCMRRIEERTGTDISGHVKYQRSYAHEEFITDYNSYQGNAYGLANTLRQTAFLKPKMRSSKVENLFYTGQLTVPGPGVPPSIISGQIVAAEVEKYISRKLKKKG